MLADAPGEVGDGFLVTVSRDRKGQRHSLLTELVKGTGANLYSSWETDALHSHCLVNVCRGQRTTWTG